MHTERKLGEMVRTSRLSCGFQVSGGVGWIRRAGRISACAANSGDGGGGRGESGVGAGVGEGRAVRFRKDGAEAARTSFGSGSAGGGGGGGAGGEMQTPNERLLAEVRATMEQLGVTAAEDSRAPPVRTFKDYGHVKPIPSFAGAAGAALISGTLWTVLNKLIALYMEHPFTTDFYVVQRITAVVRVAVVGLLALATGISGVTALGLLLLGARVSIDALSGTDTAADTNSDTAADAAADNKS